MNYSNNTSYFSVFDIFTEFFFYMKSELITELNLTFYKYKQIKIKSKQDEFMIFLVTLLLMLFNTLKSQIQCPGQFSLLCELMDVSWGRYSFHRQNPILCVLLAHFVVFFTFRTISPTNLSVLVNSLLNVYACIC